MTQTLGMVLKAARLQRRLSQLAVGSMLGVTRTAVGLWETDRHTPSSENLIRICELYSIDLQAALKGNLIFTNESQESFPTNNSNNKDIDPPHPIESSKNFGLIADDDIIPLYMTVAAPDLDCFFITERPSLILGRPSDAPHGEGIYMIAVMDSKMEPEYKKLSMIYVDGRAVAKIGNDVVVRTKNVDRFTNNSLNAFDMQECYFGRLTAYHPSHITLTHLATNKAVEISPETIVSLHPVVGRE